MERPVYLTGHDSVSCGTRINSSLSAAKIRPPAKEEQYPLHCFEGLQGHREPRAIAKITKD